MGWGVNVKRERREARQRERREADRLGITIHELRDREMRELEQRLLESGTIKKPFLPTADNT